MLHHNSFKPRAFMCLFLETQKRLHSTTGKNKCHTVYFASFVQYMLTVMLLEISKFALKSP